MIPGIGFAFLFAGVTIDAKLCLLTLLVIDPEGEMMAEKRILPRLRFPV